MKRILVVMFLVMSLLPAELLSQAPTSVSTAASAVVPTLVKYSGTLTGLNGQPLAGTVGVTFFLYKDDQGGAPLWMETQNITPDKTGRYTAVLGSTTSQGLPTDLFASGEARWLGVQAEGQAEQPRVLLLSVPYALKAGDAQTLGGMPASAFVLADSAPSKPAAAVSSAPAATTSKSSAPANPAVTGKGTIGYIPMWDTASDIVDSAIFQKSTNVGIGTTTPLAPLDVNGKSDIRDTLTLFPKSTDNTLAVSGTAFNISSAGKVTFISGQTFPGAGTITGITTATGSGLSGGGTTGTLSLKVPAAGISNAMLANSKVTLNANTAGGLTTPGAMTLGSTYTIGLKPCTTNQILQYSGTTWNCASAGAGTITGVTAGTDLTGGGTAGAVTLNLDTTKVPLLASSNTFTSEQVVNTGGITPGLSVTSGGGIYSVGNGIGITGVTTTGGIGDAGVKGMDQSGNSNSSGVYGFSSAGSGIYGGSTAGYGVIGGGGTAGVWGTSSSGNGVSGQSSGSSSAGVVGINTSTGYGVLGQATGTGGQGVWGEAFGTSFSNGAGTDGVHGVAHNTSGSGVAGINTGQDATGVYGSDPQGYGFSTDSHVSQGRSSGGWVKAMVYIQGNTGIVRCFNSQIKGSAASTPPCGMNFTYYQAGWYSVDFGFEVDDRFPSATVLGPGYVFTSTVGVVTSTQLEILTYNPTDSNYEDPAGVYLIIF
jgi:hypothetical protein